MCKALWPQCLAWGWQRGHDTLLGQSHETHQAAPSRTPRACEAPPDAGTLRKGHTEAAATAPGRLRSTIRPGCSMGLPRGRWPTVLVRPSSSHLHLPVHHRPLGGASFGGQRCTNAWPNGHPFSPTAGVVVVDPLPRPAPLPACSGSVCFSRSGGSRDSKRCSRPAG